MKLNKNSKKKITTPMELIKEQTFAENTNNSSSNSEIILENDHCTVYEGKPFNIVHDKESNKYFVGSKNGRMSELLETYEEAVNDSKRNDIERIMQIVGIITEHTLKLINTKNEN